MLNAATKQAAQLPASPVTDAELLRTARERIAELCVRYGITEPTVSLALRGRCAGRAHPKRNHMSLNAVLFRENFDEFIGNTIPHELCHLWKHQLADRTATNGSD